MEERKAINLLKHGDPAGLDVLIENCQSPAIRAVFLIVRDKEAAEDIVQSAFIRVFERFEQFNENRLFAPWFFRIVINDSIKAASRQSRPVSLDALGDEENRSLFDILSDPAPGPEDMVRRNEVRQEIWEAMAELSPEQRMG